MEEKVGTVICLILVFSQYQWPWYQTGEGAMEIEE